MLRRPLPVALMFALIAQLLFAFRVTVPDIPVFDEVHYLPAARMLWGLSGPTNIEHPLLGKWLIGLGIYLFGDGPLGWRALSGVAGTAVVVGVFAITQLLFGRVRTSAIAATLVIVNQTVFVQARIAMLDGFMAAFVVGGFALLLWAARRGSWSIWVAGAAGFGLAIGCKWTALPFLPVAWGIVLYLRRADSGRWRGLPVIASTAVLGGVATLAYFMTFAPAFLYASEPLTLATLLPFQVEMYARQTQVLPTHTYQSPWWTWPLLIRPIWYLYEPVGGAQRGILLVGNPVVMWGGLVAVIATLWAAARGAGAAVVVPALVWIASVAMWAAIPKSLGFYYYYYLSSIWLAIVIAAAFDHWRAATAHWDEAFVLLAIGLFVYFYPVLAAAPLRSAGAFRHWTWFSTWV